MGYEDTIFEYNTNSNNIKIKIDPRTGNKILTIDSEDETISFRIPDNPTKLTKFGNFTKAWGSLILASIAFILKILPSTQFNIYIDIIIWIVLVLGLKIFTIYWIHRIVSK